MGLCCSSAEEVEGGGGGYQGVRERYGRMEGENNAEEPQRYQILGEVVVAIFRHWGGCGTERQTSLFYSPVCNLL